MEETGDVRFGRSAFGGFNRKDVMEYIDKLQRSAAAKSGDPDALQQLEQERDALEAENRRLREELLQLRAQLNVGQTANAPIEEAQRDEERDASSSAMPETASAPATKGLSMKDVDEMVQKYFG